MTVRGSRRFDAKSLTELQDQLNQAWLALGNGGVQVAGIRFDVRAAAPTVAPLSGGPNLVVVNVAGTYKLYVWDKATGWVVAGTQV